MRVVLDTNIIVSAFLTHSGPRARLVAAWFEQAFEPVVSEPILAEYQRALLYTEVAARHGMSPAEVVEIVVELRRLAVLVTPEEKLAVVTADPDDDKFLEAAVAGEAAYLISGDPHLLALEQYRGIQILTPTQFLAVLAQERG